MESLSSGDILVLSTQIKLARIRDDLHHKTADCKLDGFYALLQLVKLRSEALNLNLVRSCPGVTQVSTLQQSQSVQVVWR